MYHGDRPGKFQTSKAPLMHQVRVKFSTPTEDLMVKRVEGGRQVDNTGARQVARVRDEQIEQNLQHD